MKIQCVKVIGLTAILAVLFVVSSTSAPNLINYQGVLTDDLGSPLNQTVSITLKLFNANTNGDELWTETQSVQVQNGIYNVLLGSVNPFSNDLFANDNLWLEVTVESEVLSQRQRLVSVPFSLQAQSLAPGVVPCFPGDFLNCYSGPDGTRDVGVCSGGIRTCGPNGSFGNCTNEVTPLIETCDAIDNDCDGVADNNLTPPLNPLQQGVCAGSTQVCAGASGWVEDYSIAGYENPEVSVDGLDNDCDGTVDFPSYGLDFPGSNGVDSYRFRFVDPHLNELPIYGPNGRGVTYIWRCYPRQQTGYYTTFFWGTDAGNFWWDNGTPNSFYGFHPFPIDGVHKWEIATDQGADLINFNGFVVWNTWYLQAARVWSDGSGKHTEYYYNLPDTSSASMITHTASTSYGNINPPSPALTWGDAPWDSTPDTGGFPAGQTNEVYDGIIRGIQIYNNLLSVSDIIAEADSPLSTVDGADFIWYMNVNPTPTDISDKSGRGHDPEWVGSVRPGLWSE